MFHACFYLRSSWNLITQARHRKKAVCLNGGFLLPLFLVLADYNSCQRLLSLGFIEYYEKRSHMKYIVFGYTILAILVSQSYQSSFLSRKWNRPLFSFFALHDKPDLPRVLAVRSSRLLGRRTLTSCFRSNFRSIFCISCRCRRDRAHFDRS